MTKLNCFFDYGVRVEGALEDLRKANIIRSNDRMPQHPRGWIEFREGDNCMKITMTTGRLLRVHGRPVDIARADPAFVRFMSSVVSF